MVQEQSPKYLRAFGSYHVKAPGSKLGRPPSQGHPGYNPDLMVMDLVKLRHDASYKAMIHELKVNKRGHQQSSAVVAKGNYLQEWSNMESIIGSQARVASSTQKG